MRSRSSAIRQAPATKVANDRQIVDTFPRYGSIEVARAFTWTTEAAYSRQALS
jgi:hypothetical protein